jgi:hypothetical protein
VCNHVVVCCPVGVFVQERRSWRSLSLSRSLVRLSFASRVGNPWRSPREGEMEGPGVVHDSS